MEIKICKHKYCCVILDKRNMVGYCRIHSGVVLAEKRWKNERNRQRQREAMRRYWRLKALDRED